MTTLPSNFYKLRNSVDKIYMNFPIKRFQEKIYTYHVITLNY